MDLTGIKGAVDTVAERIIPDLDTLSDDAIKRLGDTIHGILDRINGTLLYVHFSEKGPYLEVQVPPRTDATP